MKQKILVIDDEQDIVRIVKDLLESEGYFVTTAKNAAEAFKKIKESRPDLIVLDLKLPGIDGLEICRSVKNDPKTTDISVIILSTKSEESDKIVGLEIGADDYVTKPFSTGELAARVKAVLRKNTPKEDQAAVIKLGDIQVNLNERAVLAGNKGIALTKKEFELLCLFMKKNGRVLNRAYLIESVWGYEYFGTTRTVDVHVKSLRKKLGKHGSLIVTVGGMGYKFEG
jgi:two-component system alkaline phosphatase synthesis response regulator PhoP